MKPFAEKFYKSKAWENTRLAYLKSVGGLCERCLSKGIYKAAVIIHHKTHLSPDNIGDPTVSLSWNNLEALCMDCHNKEHISKGKRYKVDELGRVIITS